jgi:Brp/Blh family beta-carotene 15,15'-monooxygenase
METAEHWYGRVFVLVTGLLILAALLGRQLSPTAALVLLVAGVLLLGLPHGALDPLVARKLVARKLVARKLVARKAFLAHSSIATISFYAAYLALVAGYWVLWSRYPTLGLSLFLLIAAVHFGSDWESRGNAVTRCAYGLMIVTLPAARFPAEVASIYAMLGTEHAADLVTLSKTLAPAAVAIAAVGAALRLRQRAGDTLDLLTIVAGAMLLQPLVFFTCYFALLHSPRHLLETAHGLGMTTLQRIYREALPVVLATLLLAALAFCLLPRVAMDARILRIVFIGLAALTVPHMLLDAAAQAEIK